MLNIEHLTIHAGNVTIVDDICLSVKPGQIMAIVGGSGSGKTTIGLSILRLLPSAMKITYGRILFESNDVLTMDQELLRQIRGRQIGFIFQEPSVAFNPLLTIGQQMIETLQAHEAVKSRAAYQRSLELLDYVSIDDPKRILESYPHQLSGGLKQRAMIAQVLIGNPKLIIADEPTSNLDVLTQAAIMDVLRRINKQDGKSIIFISHDLGLVKHIADQVLVLNKGKIVEQIAATDLFKHAQHSYTRQLLEAY